MSALGGVALYRNRITTKSMATNTTWRLAYRWRLLFGFVLAIASTFIWYPISIHGEQFKALGVPFQIMLFDAAGKDYIGLLTMPSFFANVMIWLLVPDLVLWLSYPAGKRNVDG